MFGFLFGTACLVGLFWVLKRGRCWGGYGEGPGGHRRRHGFGRGGRFFWGGWVAEELVEGLDATPAQEKTIREALSELRSALGRFKDALLDTRRDLAGSVRADAFDEVRMGETFARHDDAISDFRKAVVGALAQMHAVLDERQRARLADLLESGPRRAWGS
jgi:Spy/CpxP family protein refolding chaperone